MRVLLKSPTLPLLIGLALAGSMGPARLAAQDAVARAVLFYSPTCPHCHKVMTEDLPPLAERYGARLVIVGVDVTSRAGQEMFQAALAHFGIPPEEAGVPMLVAGEEVMVGSLEIPQRFPGLIEQALAANGIDWPDVAPLRRALGAQGMMREEPPASATADTVAADTARAEGAGTESVAADTTVRSDAAAASGQPTAGPAADAPASTVRPDSDAAATAPAAAEEPAAAPSPGITRSLTSEGEAATSSLVQRFRHDLFGNGVAVAVMALLLVALAASVRLALARPMGGGPTSLAGWLVPVLTLLGIGVAAYLSLVEITGREAVCGPVGDCNAVQQSSYARLFGVLPVGVLGMVGYAAIFVTWTISRSGAASVRRRALELQWLMAFIATGFSVYLTFLEPFVIGATCMWCVSSAVIVGLLLLLTSVEMRRSIA